MDIHPAVFTYSSFLDRPFASTISTRTSASAYTLVLVECLFAHVYRYATLTCHSSAPLHRTFPFKLHTDHLYAITWTDYPSLWRADPSPEGDELWRQNWESRPMLVPADDLSKLHQDIEFVPRWLDDNSKVMVGLQAHHLLHCIDVLRKAVWTDHYWPLGNLNPGHRTHQTHCIDVLRQDLMCRAPQEVYPFIWMEEESQPTPNFNVSLQCGDWDAMWSWWRERQMTEEQVKRVWVKPESVVEWPAPEALKQEKAALREVCSRPNVSCTIHGEELDSQPGILLV